MWIFSFSSYQYINSRIILYLKRNYVGCFGRKRDGTHFGVFSLATLRAKIKAALKCKETLIYTNYKYMVEMWFLNLQTILETMFMIVSAFLLLAWRKKER